MNVKATAPRWVRVQRAADLLGVSASTVRRWADSGKIACQRTPGGQRRFSRDDLERALSGGDPSDRDRFSAGERAEQRYRLLFETSLELASTLELGEVLQLAARRLSAVLQIPDCDIYRLAGDDRMVCLASALGGVVDASWVGQEVRVSDWPCERLALETGRVVTVASLDDPRLREAERKELRRYGQRSFVALPLIARDKVIGLVDLLDHVERTYSAEEIAVAEAVGQLVALALEHAQLYEEVKNLHLGNLRALSSALSAKDYYTLGHASRVAAYITMLGAELGWPAERLEELENVAFLHDIGKIGVSDRVLLKAGPLTSEEWELMRQHPGISAEIVRPLFDQELVEGVRHHHERFDGKGYPDGLAGEAIPLIARAMCVVDCYDAMSCQRPYRPAFSYRQCLAELKPLRRYAVRPGDGRGLRLGAAAPAAPSGARRQAGPAGRAAHRPGRPRPAAQPRRRGAARVPGDGERTLRRFRDAHPPLRFVTSFAMVGDQCITVLDTGETENEVSHCGDPWLAEDELARVLAGESLLANVLTADDFGVWVSGVAPLRDEKGTVVAAVTVDAPAVEWLGQATAGERSRNLAAMLQSAAIRFSRAEVEAITDGLTGLYNHRYLHERLQEELERAERRDSNALAAVLRLRPLQDLQRHLRPQGRRCRLGAHRPHHRGLQPASRPGRPLRRRGVRARPHRHRRRGSAQRRRAHPCGRRGHERQGGTAAHGEYRRGHLPRRRLRPRRAPR